MTWMKEEAHQQFILLLSTVFSAIAAAISAPTGAPDDLWDNSRFVSTCILGSLAGAILLVSLPHARLTTRKMACEVAMAFLCGITFSPAVIEHFDISKTSTWVVPCSALVSMLALGILRGVVPLLQMLVVDVILQRIRRWLGIPAPEKPPTQKLES